MTGSAMTILAPPMLLHIVGGAAWTNATSVSFHHHDDTNQDGTDQNDTAVCLQAKAPVPLARHPRLSRANQLTRIAHHVIENTIENTVTNDTLNSPEIAPPPHHASLHLAPRRAIAACTTLATLRTNARYEQRRLTTGTAAPRDFALTATNAWVGELTAAHDILGPATCLVGPDAAAHAIATAAIWLSTAACQQAFIVAAESLPDDRELLAPSEQTWTNAAACLLVQTADTPLQSPPVATLRIDFHPQNPSTIHQPHLASSCPTTVQPFVSAMLAVQSHHPFALDSTSFHILFDVFNA